MKYLLALFLLSSTTALAISEKDVISSSLEHFPKVIEAVKQLEIEENRVTNRSGAFDGDIQGKMKARTEGYYDGDYYELKVEKPISYFNSKVFGGKRLGAGEFPVYDEEYRTLNDGELFAGFSVSLLRNSLIDMNRYNLWYQEENQKQAGLNLKQVKVNVQTMALKAYWTWYTKGHELKVYQDILTLAEERDKIIARRIKVGDLAKIYRVENNQYLLQRRADVQQKTLEFKKASYYLSLFSRTPEGAPIIHLAQELPTLYQAQLDKIQETQPIFEKSVERSLKLKDLSSKEKQAELDVKMGNNLIVPELDLQYEWRKDQGTGPNNLVPEENIVMLNLKVPFQFRKGLGKKREGKAKLEQIKVMKNWETQQLQRDVLSLKAEINSFSEIFETTKQQVSAAITMAKAERKKFNNGASDLILLNIREETLAKNQIKNLSSLLNYQFSSADLKKILVQMVVEE